MPWKRRVLADEIEERPRARQPLATFFSISSRIVSCCEAVRSAKSSPKRDREYASVDHAGGVRWTRLRRCTAPGRRSEAREPRSHQGRFLVGGISRPSIASTVSASAAVNVSSRSRSGALSTSDARMPAGTAAAYPRRLRDAGAPATVRRCLLLPSSSNLPVEAGEFQPTHVGHQLIRRRSPTRACSATDFRPSRRCRARVGNQLVKLGRRGRFRRDPRRRAGLEASNSSIDQREYTFGRITAGRSLVEAVPEVRTPSGSTAITVESSAWSPPTWRTKTRTRPSSKSSLRGRRSRPARCAPRVAMAALPSRSRRAARVLARGEPAIERVVAPVSRGRRCSRYAAVRS